MISEETKNQIKDLIDVELLLMSLGFKITRSTSNEVRSPCILHGGDNPTAFSIRTDTKRWRCFTRRCEENHAGDIQNDLFALVMRTQNISFIDAAKYLADFAGVSLDDNSTTAPSSKVDTRRFVKMINKVAPPTPITPPISEDDIRELIAHRGDYFNKEGFSADTLEFFQIGERTRREQHDDGVWRTITRATIPIRDENGKLLGVSGRRIDNNQDPRYKLDFRIDKDSTLYNIHTVISCGFTEVILVEGFKACWAVFEAGYPNVAACMGTSVLPEQILLLVRRGFSKVYLMFDGDKAGLEGMEKSLPVVGKYLKAYPIYLPNMISPDSITREELRNVIEEGIKK